MKRMSEKPEAIGWKKSAKGPSTPLRKPWDGFPPLTHARALGVANPRPKSLVEEGPHKGEADDDPRKCEQLAQDRRSNDVLLEDQATIGGSEVLGGGGGIDGGHRERLL